MAKLSRAKLENLIRQDLDLASPRFFLHSDGGRISGSIVSSTFKGMKELPRQNLLWDYLDRTFGVEAPNLIGVLFAYTPEEWEPDAPMLSRGSRAARALGKTR